MDGWSVLVAAAASWEVDRSTVDPDTVAGEGIVAEEDIAIVGAFQPPQVSIVAVVAFAS